MAEPELTKYSLCFVKITVEDPAGHKVEFEADHFEISLNKHVNSRMLIPEFHRVKPHSLVISTPQVPVEIPAPKYVPAMGDAAQAYCDEINAAGECTKFRWHEVWRRMWAARKK